MKLNDRVLAALKDVGYIKLTPIQEQSIPVAITGQDVLGLAQTGTGKTLAFILPTLEKIKKEDLGYIKALIIVPTRELAEQICQVTRQITKKTRIRSTTIYGGVSKNPQIKALLKSEIVIACPGRLMDHMSDGNINLSHVNTVVLDEADTMCDMGFLPDIKRILAGLTQQRQTMFFAATMPNEIRVLANDILNKPNLVQIGELAPALTVSHSIYPITAVLKKRILLEILRYVATGRVLVFTRTKHKANWLSNYLSKAKYRVAQLQGDMSQNRRQRSIDGFRKGKYDILVATDVASRGIDVADISHVINFDMPNSIDAYIHRIGRTGRAEQIGEALTLTLPEDEFLIGKIEAILGSPIERKHFQNFNYGDFNPLKKSSKTKQSPQLHSKHKTHSARKFKRAKLNRASNLNQGGNSRKLQSNPRNSASKPYNTRRGRSHTTQSTDNLAGTY